MPDHSRPSKRSHSDSARNSREKNKTGTNSGKANVPGLENDHFTDDEGDDPRYAIDNQYFYQAVMAQALNDGMPDPWNPAICISDKAGACPTIVKETEDCIKWSCHDCERSGIIYTSNKNYDDHLYNSDYLDNPPES